MKKLLFLLFLSTLQSLAQSPFDGTWMVDANAWLPQKPQEYSLAKGLFRCFGYTGNDEIKADGHDQKVPATSYWGTVSVRIVDVHTVEIIAKKAGRTMYTEVDTVSPDGGTLTQLLKDTTEAEAVTIETLSQRVDQGPTGSHVLSGSWRAYKISRSKRGSTITYRCTADGFSAKTPLGEGFDAKFDGKDYPVEDDPAHGMVSVKLLGRGTVELTFKRNGKVVALLHLTVEPNGKSIDVVNENKESGTTTTYKMQKQPQ